MNLSLNLLGKMQTNMKMEELEVLELLEEFQEVVEASAVDKKMKREFSLKKKFLLKKFSFSEIFFCIWRIFSFSLDFPLFPVFLPKSQEMKSTFRIRFLIQHIIWKSDCFSENVFHLYNKDVGVGVVVVLVAEDK